MKITMEHEGNTYSVEERQAITVSDALELIERLLICAGFSIKRDSLNVDDNVDDE